MNQDHRESNLNFAAVLLTEGKEFKGVEAHPTKPRLSVFVFADDGTFANLWQDFIHRKLRVEPVLYWENVRYLKNVISEQSEKKG